MIKGIKIVFSVLVALIVTIFAVKNSQVIAINLWPLPLQFKLTLSLVLIGTFTFGALCGAFLVWISAVFKRLFKEKEEAKRISEDSSL